MIMFLSGLMLVLYICAIVNTSRIEQLEEVVRELKAKRIIK